MERLSTSYVFNRTLSGVMENRAKLVDMYEQISSGKQIRKASDDPVLSARILDYQRNVSDIEQSERYVTTAINDLSSEEASLTQVQTLLIRARTLVMQGRNGTQGAENKAIIGSEVNQIIEQVAKLSNTLNADGAYIFSGYRADNEAYTFTRVGDDIVSATYNGDSNSVEKTVSPTLKVKVSHPGSEVFTASVDMFAELITARDDLLAGNPPSDANLNNIDESIDNVTQSITDIGARTNQVQSASEVNQLLKNSMEVALGKIRDLDLPTAITHFTQLETSVQAINNTFARISKMSLFDYI